MREETIPPTELMGTHLRTYQAIFRHPTAHNLKWDEVQALFRNLGQVSAEKNGNLTFYRNGKELLVPAPTTKEVEETEQVIRLRDFLRRSDKSYGQVATAPGDWLVVVNHREIRIYRSLFPGSAPDTILPHPKDQHFRQAAHAAEFTRGKEIPDPNTFFAPVAEALKEADRILLFGSGTGHASEMEQLNGWLKIHHSNLAAKVVGTVVIDEHHLSEGQIIAQAADFYSRAKAGSP
jgi:hypothetical protein